MNMRVPLKNETVQPFFAVRVLGESLVTTFIHRHQVASWAPLQGGSSTVVTSILIGRHGSARVMAHRELRDVLFPVGSEEARREALASVHRPNCTDGFAVCSFREDSTKPGGKRRN